MTDSKPVWNSVKKSIHIEISVLKKSIIWLRIIQYSAGIDTVLEFAHTELEKSRV